MGASLYLAGYEPVHEPWMYLYVSIIAISGFICWGLLVLDYGRQYRLRDCPQWMIISGGLAILLGFTPYGIMMLYMLNVFLFASAAPIGASIICAVFSIFPYYSFVQTVTPKVRG